MKAAAAKPPHDQIATTAIIVCALILERLHLVTLSDISRPARVEG